MEVTQVMLQTKRGPQHFFFFFAAIYLLHEWIKFMDD